MSHSFSYVEVPCNAERKIGTPLPDLASTKKDKLEYVPEWQQEVGISHTWAHEQVRDEQGRRRFHGAFTGGFSAGYFNSVGSKEGRGIADDADCRLGAHRVQVVSNQSSDEDTASRGLYGR